MTDWAMQSDAVNSRILPRLLGAFVRERTSSAKQLALLIDCDERTAFKIRAGEVWPIARHLFALWVEFGEDMVEALFHPERVEARALREAAQREQARQQRIAAASRLAEPAHFGVAGGLDQPDRRPEEPSVLEPGPPNLDLFEDTRSDNWGESR